MLFNLYPSPIPIAEFPSEFSFGYNGTDYYSPEGDYGISDPSLLQAYLKNINRLLLKKQKFPYEIANIATPANQLRAVIDVCHVYGIAVLFDVVYNHAGGGFDSNSIFFYDKMSYGDNNDSLFFTNQGWAGGLVFAYWDRDVCQFLIDNAKCFLEEYHVDGFRHDEVSVIDRYGGWLLCQNMTDTCRYFKPSAIQIAEYWPQNSYVTKPTNQGGAGYDASWSDLLRESARSAIAQASAGAHQFVNMDGIAFALQEQTFVDKWRAIQYLESHDEIKIGSNSRISRIADPSDAHSWYARSRSRVSIGLLLTTPGIPMIFMGEEFMEDKQWSDNPQNPNLIWWKGLENGQKPMIDFLRFTQDLIHLRSNYLAFRSNLTNVFHVHNDNRILAFHRWLENTGQDVVIVISLNESSFYNYQLGFPLEGKWSEIFNSDVYDNWVNPNAVGNRGSINADGFALHGLPTSATIVIPPNSILIFSKS